MVREISREVDYIMESFSLLRHLGEGRSYQEMKETLNRKYANPFREGLRKFEVLEQIEHAARSAFSEDMEQLQYYFPKRDDAALGCVGNLVLLWEDFKHVDFQDITAYGNYLKGLTEQEYCENFGVCLQGYTESVVRDGKTAKMSDPYAIICYLMTMEIKDEEKWKIQKIFLDRTKHIERLIGLLEKAEALLHHFQKELEELARMFYQYWSEQLEERDLTTYIKEAANVNVENSPFGFCLQVSIICSNVIVLYKDMGADGITYEKPDYYRIGILFGEDFNISINPELQGESYENYAVSVLKLLADKSKFAILSYIRDKEAYGSELAKHLNLTTATVSHHMNALLVAGLVKVSHVDNRVYYTTNKNVLEKVLDYCKGVLT